MIMKFYLFCIFSLIFGFAEAQNKCEQCHLNDIQISSNHPSIKGLSATDCAVCHQNQNNLTFKFLHFPHQGRVPCNSCHIEKDGSVDLNLAPNFGVKVSKDDFELFGELLEAEKSSANLHLRKRLSCSACHKEIPAEGAEVGKEVCLSCHDSYEAIAKKTQMSGKMDNPHESHQGKLECNRCHSGHSAAKSYCLECHSNFKQFMPEGRQ